MEREDSIEELDLSESNTTTTTLHVSKTNSNEAVMKTIKNQTRLFIGKGGPCEKDIVRNNMFGVSFFKFYFSRRVY